MEKVVLEVSNLNKHYTKGNKVVDNISFSVERGDIFGFLGPNGAGKTTTIRMILGLLKADSGEVFICGKSVNKDFYDAISNVGALVEGPAFYEYLSAKENLNIFAHYSGNVSKEHIEEVLQLVGLYERKDEKVKNYSLGMKQRLGIAQTLLNKPKLIILDEPTNGLDPDGITEMRKLLIKLSREKGITIFVSSHILAEVQELCNKILIINKGRKVIIGDTKELLSNNESTYIIESKNKSLLMSAMKKIKGVEVINSEKCMFNLGENNPEEILSQLVSQKLSVSSFEKYSVKLEDLYFSVMGDEEK